MSEINFEELGGLVDYVAGEGTYTVGYVNMQGDDDRVSFSDFDAYTIVNEGDYADENTYLAAVEVQEQADHVYEQLDKHGEDVIRAAVKHMASSGLTAIDPMNLKRYLANNFRGEYESPAAYAQSYVQDTTDSEELEKLSRFLKYVDWAAYAAAEFDEDFVRLTDDTDEHTGTPSGNVFVFDNDPRV